MQTGLATFGKLTPLGSAARRRKMRGMQMPPQQLSQEAIKDFKAIYQTEFGQELSDDSVQEIAVRLLQFFGILYPLHSGKNKE